MCFGVTNGFSFRRDARRMMYAIRRSQSRINETVYALIFLHHSNVRSSAWVQCLSNALKIYADDFKMCISPAFFSNMRDGYHPQSIIKHSFCIVWCREPFLQQTPSSFLKELRTSSIFHPDSVKESRNCNSFYSFLYHAWRKKCATSCVLQDFSEQAQSRVWDNQAFHKSCFYTLASALAGWQCSRRD